MSFANCDQAYAAGQSNIPKSSPNYSAKLDRDRDGIACDNPPPGFKPAGNTSTGTAVTPPGGADQLPKTGPAMEVGIVGALLVAAGALAVVRSRRRRVHFTA